MNNDNPNENNSKHIKGVTFHVGGRFVRVYGDDAKIMHLIFNYQALYEKKRKALRAGFPVEALVKNIRKLTSEGIMVIVDEDFDDKVKKLLSNEEYDQYLNVSIEGLNAVATDGFKQFIKDKGLTHHPEFIKTFHKIGQLCKDADIPNVKFPAGVKQDAADVLYGSKE